MFFIFCFADIGSFSSGWIQFKWKKNSFRGLWDYCKERWEVSWCRNCGDSTENGRGSERSHLWQWEEKCCCHRWWLIRKVSSIQGLFARFSERAARDRKLKQCGDRTYKRWIWHRLCSVGCFKLHLQTRFIGHLPLIIMEINILSLCSMHVIVDTCSPWWCIWGENKKSIEESNYKILPLVHGRGKDVSSVVGWGFFFSNCCIEIWTLCKLLFKSLLVSSKMNTVQISQKNK